MEEEQAPIAEAHYFREMTTPGSRAHAEVAIGKGRAVLQDVVVNGKSLLKLEK